jgi:hypothetical protein
MRTRICIYYNFCTEKVISHIDPAQADFCSEEHASHFSADRHIVQCVKFFERGAWAMHGRWLGDAQLIHRFERLYSTSRTAPSALGLIKPGGTEWVSAASP